MQVTFTLRQKLLAQPISGEVDRASVTESVDSDSISGASNHRLQNWHSQLP